MLGNIYTKFANLFPEQFASDLNHYGFKRYFKNTGWLFSSRIFNMGISFFVTALVVRYLGPNNYGLLSYAFSFVGLFSFISTLGIDSILLRDLVKYPEREKEYMGTALLLRVVLGMLASAGTIAISFAVPNEPIIRALIVIISMTYAFQAFNIINFIFHARVQAKYPSIITIIVIVLLSILKIFVVMYGKGVYYLAAVYAIEPVLYGIFLFWFYKKICGNPFEWTFKKETAKEMLREGFPLMLSSVFVIIYSRIDQIILKQMIDVAAVGIYDVAVRLSEVWYFIPGIIAGSVFPSIINAQKTNEAMYAKRLIYLTGFLVITSAFVGLVVTVFAKFIIVTIFGGEFASGYTALQFYVWSGVGISIGSVLSQYLIAEKLASTLLYISIIGMVLNVVLNFALIPVMGIAGSALATLISYIVGPVSVMAFKVPRQKILALFKLI